MLKTYMWSYMNTISSAKLEQFWLFPTRDFLFCAILTALKWAELHLENVISYTLVLYTNQDLVTFESEPAVVQLFAYIGTTVKQTTQLENKTFN